jgi:predicted DCC family thiol-disulfide oxidoreductase YuxK
MTAVRTGGQYSLVRAALGLSVAGYALWFALVRRPELAAQGLELSPITFVLLGGLGLGLACGRFDRWAGLLLLVLWYGLHRSLGESLDRGVIALELMLALNAFVPRAPYGSWDARGRVDPGGGWRAPEWVFPFARLAFVAQAVVLGVMALAWVGFDAFYVASLVAAPLLFVPRARLWAWSALFVASVALLAKGGLPTDFTLAVLLLFLFEPGWVAPVRRAGPVRVFYDGTCGLCHGFVRFVLAEDRAGSMRFAPLQGPTFEREVPAERRAGLPDSVVVVDDSGRVLVRSEGVLYVLATLGGWWRVAASASSLVPRGLRDLAYDGIARIRKRVFGTTKDACPLMPREFGARFEA